MISDPSKTESYDAELTSRFQEAGGQVFGRVHDEELDMMAAALEPRWGREA